MRFSEFFQRAITSLAGKQNDDGTWFSDAPATCAAVEALLEHNSGPERICRQSLLYRLSHASEENRVRHGWIPLSYAWQWNVENISARNRGILSFPRLIDRETFNPWILAKIARILAVTDPDYWLGYSSVLRPLWEFEADEPWLVAQIGLARLHFDHPYDNSPKDKAYIVGYVDKLLATIAGSHWESRTITPEECTGIVCTFLFHNCTEFLLCQIDSTDKLDRHRDSCAKWLADNQQDSGAWDNSPHVTSHCLRAILSFLVSRNTNELQYGRLKLCLDAGIQYLLAKNTLHTWETLSAYQQIEILATLIQVCKSDVLDSDFLGQLEIESEALRPDVFISYGGCDSLFALRLAKDLEACGVNVWFAEWDIDYGDDIVQEIERGLDATRKFVIVLSPEALKRPWVRQELSAAFHQALSGPGKLIVPVLLEQCDLPRFLATKKRMDFSIAENYDQSVKELARRLKGKGKTRG